MLDHNQDGGRAHGLYGPLMACVAVRAATSRAVRSELGHHCIIAVVEVDGQAAQHFLHLHLSSPVDQDAHPAEIVSEKNRPVMRARQAEMSTVQDTSSLVSYDPRRRYSGRLHPASDLLPSAVSPDWLEERQEGQACAPICHRCSTEVPVVNERASSTVETALEDSIPGINKDLRYLCMYAGWLVVRIRIKRRERSHDRE